MNIFNTLFCLLPNAYNSAHPIFYVHMVLDESKKYVPK
jgi:hypothetical protein